MPLKSFYSLFVSWRQHETVKLDYPKKKIDLSCYTKVLKAVSHLAKELGIRDKGWMDLVKFHRILKISRLRHQRNDYT